VTLALVGDEWLASGPAVLTLEENPHKPVDERMGGRQNQSERCWRG
jgi:hypothetical protein